jgi:uncharacterized HAD superfamily protein
MSFRKQQEGHRRQQCTARSILLVLKVLQQEQHLMPATVSARHLVSMTNTVFDFEQNVPWMASTMEYRMIASPATVPALFSELPMLSMQPRQ